MGDYKIPNKKNFAFTGASRYIAPRHMKATTETRNDLVVALDLYDGIVTTSFNWCHY